MTGWFYQIYIYLRIIDIEAELARRENHDLVPALYFLKFSGNIFIYDSPHVFNF